MIIAAYGTLRKGWGNHRLLETSRFLGEYKTEPNYIMFDGIFPIVEREGNTSIHVELYETDDQDVINRINWLEHCTGKKGHSDNWYDLEFIETEYGLAQMYVMNKGKSGRKQILENGKWR